jgi:uncharacterized protein
LSDIRRQKLNFAARLRTAIITPLNQPNRKSALLLSLVAFVCLFAASAVATFAQQDPAMQSPVPQPNPPRPVVDTANVIDDATEQRLNELLINLDKQAAIEFGVVTVPTTGDRAIFDYSLAIMRGWGIGSSEKPGLLLVLAINDRKYYTQVSRHLEGDLPDGLVGQIQRERLVPLLKQGNYSGAISDTVQAFVATLSEKRGFTIANVDRSKATRQRQRETSPASGLSGKACFGIIIFAAIIIFLMGRGKGSGGGCMNLLFLGSLLSNLSNRSGSSGWSGGGFGGSGGSSGWGGGGGGDWGGFSGGGGDAGGGGAGGGW